MNKKREVEVLALECDEAVRRQTTLEAQANCRSDKLIHIRGIINELAVSGVLDMMDDDVAGTLINSFREKIQKLNF